MPAPPRVLLFDVLGTLVHDPFYSEVPKFFGMTLEQLYAVKDPRSWPRFERGEGGEEELYRDFFLDRRPIDGPGMKRAMRRAYAWQEGMEELVAALVARGQTLHLLSNYPAWYRMIEERLSLSRYAPWTFVSCETSLRKPDPETFLHAAQTLGVEPAQCLLIDDRERNCEGARSVGMAAIHFEGAAPLCEQLQELGVSFQGSTHP